MKKLILFLFTLIAFNGSAQNLDSLKVESWYSASSGMNYYEISFKWMGEIYGTYPTPPFFGVYSSVGYPEKTNVFPCSGDVGSYFIVSSLENMTKKGNIITLRCNNLSSLTATQGKFRTYLGCTQWVTIPKGGVWYDTIQDYPNNDNFGAPNSVAPPTTTTPTTTTPTASPAKTTKKK